MRPDGPQLLALALELAAHGADDDETVAILVEAAQGSATTLMAAGAYAVSLARDLPHDVAHERTVGLLTLAVQRAVQRSGDPIAEDRAGLLRHILEVSGGAPMTRHAVATRTAELDADLEKLRSGS